MLAVINSLGVNVTKLIVTCKYLIVFSFGLALGHLVPFDAARLKEAGSIATILGSVGTCIAAFAALKAVNTWREQLYYSEKVRLVNNLEDSFTELHKSIINYRQSAIMVVKTEMSGFDVENLKILKRKELDCKQHYFDSRSMYFDHYERLSRVTELTCNNVIHPDIVQRKVVELINGIRPIYKGDDFEKSNQLLDSNDALHIALWKEAKKGFESLRKNG